jgi:M6 family metalloprotease-like protein
LFASQESFAQKEMTGHLKVVGVYSTEQITESYIFWFQEVDTNYLYKINPDTLPHNVLDMAGEKVKIIVEEEPSGFVTSGESQNPVLDLISIQKIEIPEGISGMITPTTWRSVTLLSKFSDVGTTPSEDPISFKIPRGVAIDSSDNLYVADSDTGSFDHLIQKFNSNGVFLEKIGSLCQLSTSAGCNDPDGGGPLESGDGQFLFPSDVAVDSLGNMIVADNNNHRVQKLDSSGSFLFKLGASGGDGTSGDGDGEFWFPFGVATDSANNIYVTDTTNSRIEKFDSSGNFIGWLGFCNSGSDCNLGNSTSMGFSCTAATCSPPIGSTGDGHFNGPKGIAIDSSDKIYVADTSNHRVQVFDSSGNFLSKFGSSGSGDGQFNSPIAIATDNSEIFVADTGNNRVQVFNSAGVFQLKFGSMGSGDGQFDSPEGIEVDSLNNIFVSDKNNLRVQKFNSTGGFVSKIVSSSGQSHDSSYYQTLFYDGPLSVNQYYNASSYGKFVLNGTVNGWNTVASSQAALEGDFNQMLDEAIAAHDSEVDFCGSTPVTNVILVFNGPVSTIANSAFGSVNSWGASYSFTNDGCTVPITVVWNPDNGGFFCCGQRLDKGIGVTAHEIGHNLGFGHTPLPPGDWRNEFNPIATDPYHDTYSLMSTNRDLESPSALITAQRNATGWMDAGNIVTISDGNSNTISLDFINEPEGGVNPQMIVVPIANGSSYIIEAHKDEVWNDTPQDRTGAVMYKYFPNGNQYSYLSLQSDKDAKYSIVATAGTNTTAQIDQAILESNESYFDNINSVNVTTQSINSTFITVFVSNNASSDGDSDGIPDGSDNCPATPNSGQEDLDADGSGDACDSINVISAPTTATVNHTLIGNLIVQNSSLLTINAGVTMTIPSGSNITIQSGSGVLIKSGGTLDVLS